DKTGRAARPHNRRRRNARGVRTTCVGGVKSLASYQPACRRGCPTLTLSRTNQFVSDPGGEKQERFFGAPGACQACAQFWEATGSWPAESGRALPGPATFWKKIAKFLSP